VGESREKEFEPCLEKQNLVFGECRLGMLVSRPVVLGSQYFAEAR
jgi:hypothetical protein